MTNIDMRFALIAFAAIFAFSASALTVNYDGDEASMIVDGKPVAKIDMKTKCNGCSFSPVFAVGGMSGGFGVAGFSEPRGADGVLLDDVRVFTRAFRAKESASYAATFGPDYRGAEVCYKNSKTRQMQFKGNAI